MPNSIYKLIDLLFSKTVLGLIAMIGLVALFHPDWFYEKRPELAVEIVSNSDVFGVREPLAKLKVLYDQQELSAKSDTIKLITFRVINSGNEAVKIGDFDPKFPLGITIRGGELIEIPTIIASNEYQKSIQLVSSKTSRSVNFGPLILDQGEFFTVGILVLTKSRQAVSIEPTGKVAGISRIKLLDATGGAKESFIEQAFGGNLSIQIVRGCAYFFGAILSILATVAVIALPFDLRDNQKARQCRRERRRHIEDFIKNENLKRDTIFDVIFNLYLNQPLRHKSPYEALVYAAEHKMDIGEILSRSSSMHRHPVSDEPIGWESRSPNDLEWYLQVSLKRFHEIDGDLKQNAELLKSKIAIFDAYIRSAGIAPVRRSYRAVEGFWYSGDKFHKEEFDWR